MITSTAYLPYFLLLLKSNPLLSNIIKNETFSKEDLNQTECIVYTDQVVNFPNFALSKDDTFSNVEVIIIKDEIIITFFTNNSKYFNNTKYYFQRDTLMRGALPITLYGIESQTQKKNLGSFEMFESKNHTANVAVRHSNLTNYTITVSFDRDDMLQKR